MFEHVADVTEIHHGTEPTESINEINDIVTEINESATNRIFTQGNFNC